jgi:ATP-dependent RNA circularization protein (DNA/RNA ligase family)
MTPEEEDELITKVAEKIHERQMEAVAILTIESSKPFAYIGGELGRAFLTPFIPIFSESWGLSSEKLFLTFEKRKNIDKLLHMLEKLGKEGNKPKKITDQETTESQTDIKSSEDKVQNESEVKQSSQKTQRKWWSRFLPLQRDAGKSEES